MHSNNGSEPTLRDVMARLDGIDGRLEQADGRMDRLESGVAELKQGQKQLRTDLIDAFHEALARAAQGQLSNIRQFRRTGGA